MRYIQLNRNEGKTSFERVIKYGCGPKFVKNRKKTFEMMIKEQGGTFWFRVWLSFCTHPECSVVPIEKKYQRLFSYACIMLHEGFVSGSHQDICDFCWSVLFAVGKPLPGVKKKHLLDQLQFAIDKLVLLSFSLKLSEIFYEWLLARNIDRECKIHYWTIPEAYLEEKFNPGPLEHYLASFWRKVLFALLGINKCQLPWLAEIMPTKMKQQQETKDDKYNRDKDIDSYRCKVVLYIEYIEKLVENADEPK